MDELAKVCPDPHRVEVVGGPVRAGSGPRTGSHVTAHPCGVSRGAGLASAASKTESIVEITVSRSVLTRLGRDHTRRAG